MVRLVSGAVLIAFGSSWLVNSYMLDFTCDCYDFVEESISSAFSLAENAYKMLDAAKDGTGDQKTNAAVKTLSQVMFGKEDAAWTTKGKGGYTPWDVYYSVANLNYKREAYENVATYPRIKVIEENGRKRPDRGWAKKLNEYEFVFYCDTKNWSPASSSKKGPMYDWALDATLQSATSKSLQEAMESCNGGAIFDDKTMAFTYALGELKNPTSPIQVSQITLCPWFLQDKKKKQQTSVAELKSSFDQFKGDPVKMKSLFKKMVMSDTPEIERFLPLDQVILHELTHLPQNGKAADAPSQSKCYGWRNCAKMSKTPDGVTNADSLAYFALALWFISQDVCVTANGNLEPSDAALAECGATQPGVSDSTKKSDTNWEQKAQSEGESGMRVTGEASNPKVDATYFPQNQYKRDDE